MGPHENVSVNSESYASANSLCFSVTVRARGRMRVSVCINRSQERNGRLCRVAVTDLGEFAPAVTIIVCVI